MQETESCTTSRDLEGKVKKSMGNKWYDHLYSEVDMDVGQLVKSEEMIKNS